MASFRIRPAVSADLETIVDFNERLALESEGRQLVRTTLASGVVALLEDSEKGRYFIAETETGETAGQLMITYEWSDWRNGVFWWLQSVYVRPTFRKQGVFSALFDHVAAQARDEGDACGIRLYVENENAPAQATYHARGFERANYEVMELAFPS